MKALNERRSISEAERERLIAILTGLLVDMTRTPTDGDVPAMAERIAEGLLLEGVTLRERGVWLLDRKYAGKSKKIYYCSLCNHWQSVSAYQAKRGKIEHMRYCPFCGAELWVEGKQNHG